MSATIVYNPFTDNLDYKGASGGGGGDVSGPGSSTDRAIATWNGTGGNELFDNPTTNIDTDGRFTNSGQTAFGVYVSANQNNVTGDGTSYLIPFDTASYDNGGDYDLTSHQFEAPVTGIYLFTGAVYSYFIDSSHTQSFITVSAGSNVFQLYTVNPFNMSGNQILALPFSIMIHLSAGDFVKIGFTVSGGGKTVGVAGAIGTTGFQGILLPA